MERSDLYPLQEVQDKIRWCKEMREAAPPLPTVPSTIAEEKLINPFMRVTVTWSRQL